MLMWLCSLAAAMGFAVRTSVREQCVRESSSAQPYRCPHNCQAVCSAGLMLVSYMTLAPSCGASTKKSLTIRKKASNRERTQPLQRILAAPPLHEQLGGGQSYCTY